MRRLLPLFAAALLSAGLGACSKEPQQPAAAVPQVEADTTRIFASSFPDLSGQVQSLEQWRGKVIVLNFWATWCPPCRAEMPAFVKLQEQYRSQGVVFVGLALDEKDKVQAFVDELGVTYPILLGGDSAVELGKMAGNRLGGLPFTAIFDKKGVIVSRVVGELPPDRLEGTLKPLL